MHDVRVVPHRLCGNLTRTDFHAQHATVNREIVRHAVQTNQRTLVVRKLIEDARRARRAAGVLDVDGLHRIGINADNTAVVVVERVVDDDGLRAANVNYRSVVPHAGVSGTAVCSVRIEFKRRVRQTQIGLMGFNGREVGIVSGNRHTAAAVSDVGLIDVDAAPLSEEQATPIPFARRVAAKCIETVAGRIERAARTAVTIVFERGEDHRQRCCPFGNQLRRTSFSLNARFAEFNHDSRINLQPASRTSREDTTKV